MTRKLSVFFCLFCSLYFSFPIKPHEELSATGARLEIKGSAFLPEASGTTGGRQHVYGEDPAVRATHASAEKKLLQVVAVQVPDEVQAHRRHRPDNIPPRVRAVQSRVLVDVPFSGESGWRVSLDEEALGSRDVARGHLYYSQPRSTTAASSTSATGNLSVACGTSSGTSSRLPKKHHHHHHHHSHHHHHHHHHHRLQQHQQDQVSPSPSPSPSPPHSQCSQRSTSHHHQHSPSSSSVTESDSREALERRACSRTTVYSRPGSRSRSRSRSRSHSRSPGRQQALPSLPRQAEPSLTARHAEPMGSLNGPAAAAVAIAVQRQDQQQHEHHEQQRQAAAESAAKLFKQDFKRFKQMQPGYTDRCCWGLLPKRWFTCNAKGSAQIDVMARFAFPFMFLMFNLCYWSTYAGRDDVNRDHN